MNKLKKSKVKFFEHHDTNIKDLGREIPCICGANQWKLFWHKDGVNCEVLCHVCEKEKINKLKK
jgi:hypothetical protein